MGNIIFIPSGTSGISGSGATPGALVDTFETFSKNLRSYPYNINYSGKNISSIVYTTGTGNITKTLNYTGNNLTSVVLSGSIPSGINTTKTLNYMGKDLTSVTYS